ncbi:MAG TPA: LytR C-terminal domain-containing protein [Candidatus Sulfotelmatobacter sp.]|nr:LytR C-terminal domain-containing protein [Candidatus Sulfotelmatobacter sp.]
MTDTEKREIIDKKNIFKKIAMVFFICLFLLLVCVSAYLFYQYQTIKKQLTNSPLMAVKAAQEKTKKLVSEISQFMELPKNEMPTLATVTDISRLKEQLFFQKAKNGDELLIFTKEKLAILYDPNVHKIVTVGPVTIGNQPSQSSQAKIVLRNGTDVSGLTSKAEAQLKKTFPGIDVAKKEQAAKSTYSKTIVVTLNAKAKNAAVSLAKLYNAPLSDLPAHEKKPEGMDILIILGVDQASALTATQAAQK